MTFTLTFTNYNVYEFGTLPNSGHGNLKELEFIKNVVSALKEQWDEGLNCDVGSMSQELET